MRLKQILITLLFLLLTSCNWNDFMLIWPFKPDVCGKTVPLTQDVKDLKEKAKTSLEIDGERFVVHGEAIRGSQLGSYCPECECVGIAAEIQKENTYVPDKRFQIKKVWAINKDEVWIWTSENSSAFGPKWPRTESSGIIDKVNGITIVFFAEDKTGKQYLLKKDWIPIVEAS